ncbi:hypothetical protein DID88_010445 [Monilinia fructigena]|uniref:Rhodopsin domain-containing protein n=1 Tax=Monilinia fructigena TaxID=38457 RepID=A0A395ILE8_9HELO|nr:hypothetical protein DID88_010445 [Monilinia fructigena]
MTIPLRIFSRRISSTNLWFDDWFIFVAYLFACGVFAATILCVIVTAWGISVIVVSATSCIPLKALWNLEVHGKCVSLTKFYLGISFPNVITDWIIGCLRTFHRGQFCLYRIPRSSYNHFTSKSHRYHLGLVDLDVWTCVESFSAVLCACLPSLKPIFNLMTGKPANQASRSTGKGVYTGSQSNKSTWKNNKPSVTTDTLPGSIARLRDDDAWAPVTTAEGTNSPDIGLKEVGKKTNEINVTKEIAWRESRK